MLVNNSHFVSINLISIENGDVQFVEKCFIYINKKNLFVTALIY